MATAICITCQTARFWSASRGSRLKDQRCSCGGTLVRAEWSDGSYQLPQPKTPKARIAAEPLSATGTISVIVDGKLVKLPARQGDEVDWKRNGVRGLYRVKFIAFRGPKAQIELLSHSDVGPLDCRRVWVRGGFLRFTPTAQNK